MTPNSENHGGRRRGAGRRQVRLMLRFEPEDYARLQAFARDLDSPPDDVAKNIVLAHLEMRRSPFPEHPEQN